MAKQKSNSIPQRNHKSFVKEVQDMQLKRLIAGRDKPSKPLKFSRATLAMSRHRLFPQMKKDIIEAELIDE